MCCYCWFVVGVIVIVIVVIVVIVVVVVVLFVLLYVNLRLKDKDFVKLIDFGCLSLFPLSPRHTKTYHHTTTLATQPPPPHQQQIVSKEDKVKVFRGTREYASPEMLNVAEFVLKNKGKGGKKEKGGGGGYCQNTDIWGLGVVMFFALGGYPPFIGDTVCFLFCFVLFFVFCFLFFVLFCFFLFFLFFVFCFLFLLLLLLLNVFISRRAIHPR